MHYGQGKVKQHFKDLRGYSNTSLLERNIPVGEFITFISTKCISIRSKVCKPSIKFDKGAQATSTTIEFGIE